MPVRFGISDGHCQRGFRHRWRWLNVFRNQTTQGISSRPLAMLKPGRLCVKRRSVLP